MTPALALAALLAACGRSQQIPQRDVELSACSLLDAATQATTAEHGFNIVGYVYLGPAQDVIWHDMGDGGVLPNLLPSAWHPLLWPFIQIPASPTAAQVRALTRACGELGVLGPVWP